MGMCIWIAHHYTNLWANPTDVGWSTAFDPYPGPAHTCAENSEAPDRVIFVAAQWTETTTAECETDLKAIVNNINTKFKNPKRIELMALTSGPPAAPCPYAGTTGNAPYHPTDRVRCDRRYAGAVPNPGRCASALRRPKCSDFNFDATSGDTLPQYTDAGATDVAQNVFAPYYLANP